MDEEACGSKSQFPYGNSVMRSCESSSSTLQRSVAATTSRGSSSQAQKVQATLIMGLEAVIKDPLKTYSAKVQALLAAWGHLAIYLKICTAEDTTTSIIEWIHGHSLKLIFQGEWPQLCNAMRTHLTVTIQSCCTAVASNGCESKLRTLISLVHNPWGHTVLERLFQRIGGSISDEDVVAFCEEEKVTTLAIRLETLCDSQCEDLALRLSRICLRYVRLKGLYRNESVAVHVTYIMDVHIALLYKKKRTKHIIALLKSIELAEGALLVQRFTEVRACATQHVWRNSLHVAELSAQYFLTVAMVKPFLETEHFLTIIMNQWTLLQGDTILPTLPNMIRKLIQPARTAQHIYAFCRVLSARYGDAMKTLCIELYIQGLTYDMNELEQQKAKKDPVKVSEAEGRLSQGFLELGELVEDNLGVCRECVLTAFSIYPTRACYAKLKELAIAQPEAPPHVDTGQRWTKANMPNFGTKRCALHPPFDPDTGLPPGELCYTCGSFTGIEANPDGKKIRTLGALIKGDTMTKSRNYDVFAAPSIVLDAKSLGLTPQVLDDLTVVLSGPRYLPLSWAFDWGELSSTCEKYLENSATRNKDTELKYLNIDYNQFKDWPRNSDVTDDSSGIEKGYEDCIVWPEEEEEETKTIHSVPTKVYKRLVVVDVESDSSLDRKRQSRSLKSVRRLDIESDNDSGSGLKKQYVTQSSSMSGYDTCTQDSITDSLGSDGCRLDKPKGTTKKTIGKQLGKKKVKEVYPATPNEKMSRRDVSREVPGNKVLSIFKVDENGEKVGSTHGTRPTTANGKLLDKRVSDPSVVKSLRMFRHQNSKKTTPSSLDGKSQPVYAPMVSTLSISPRIILQRAEDSSQQTSPKKPLTPNNLQIDPGLISRKSVNSKNPFQPTSKGGMAYDEVTQSALDCELIKAGIPGLNTLELLVPPISEATVQVVQLPRNPPAPTPPSGTAASGQGESSGAGGAGEEPTPTPTADATQTPTHYVLMQTDAGPARPQPLSPAEGLPKFHHAFSNKASRSIYCQTNPSEASQSTSAPEETEPAPVVQPSAFQAVTTTSPSQIPITTPAPPKPVQAKTSGIINSGMLQTLLAAQPITRDNFLMTSRGPILRIFRAPSRHTPSMVYIGTANSKAPQISNANPSHVSPPSTSMKFVRLSDLASQAGTSSQERPVVPSKEAAGTGRSKFNAGLATTSSTREPQICILDSSSDEEMDRVSHPVLQNTLVKAVDTPTSESADVRRSRLAGFSAIQNYPATVTTTKDPDADRGTPKLSVPANSTPAESASSSLEQQLLEFDVVLKQFTETSKMKEKGEIQPDAVSTSSEFPVAHIPCLKVPTVSRMLPVPGGVAKPPAKVTKVVMVSSNCPAVVSPSISISSSSSSPCVSTSSSAGKTSPSKSPKSSKSKSIKTSPSTSTGGSKASPIPKPQQKPQEDEQTAQRIYAILDDYAEQIRNSPDLNNKPAPRRRSNPPTNPSQNSKRKKSSHSKVKLLGQQSCSTTTEVDEPSLLGSEDSCSNMMSTSQVQDSPAVSQAGDVDSSSEGGNLKSVVTDPPHTLLCGVQGMLFKEGTPDKSVMPIYMHGNVRQMLMQGLKGHKVIRVQQVSVPGAPGTSGMPGATLVLRQMIPPAFAQQLPAGTVSSQSLSGVVVPVGSHPLATPTPTPEASPRLLSPEPQPSPSTVRRCLALSFSSQSTLPVITNSRFQLTDNSECEMQVEVSERSGFGLGADSISVAGSVRNPEEATTERDVSVDRLQTSRLINSQTRNQSEPLFQTVNSSSATTTGLSGEPESAATPDRAKRKPEADADTESKRVSSADGKDSWSDDSPTKSLLKNRLLMKSLESGASKSVDLATERKSQTDSSENQTAFDEKCKQSKLAKRKGRRAQSKEPAKRSRRLNPMATDSTGDSSEALERLHGEKVMMTANDSASEVEEAPAAREKKRMRFAEVPLHKSLSEECEDLGVDRPSTSELFPEADLLLDTNSSPGFDASCSRSVAEPVFAEFPLPPTYYSSTSEEGNSNDGKPKPSPGPQKPGPRGGPKRGAVAHKPVTRRAAKNGSGVVVNGVLPPKSATDNEYSNTDSTSGEDSRLPDSGETWESGSSRDKAGADDEDSDHFAFAPGANGKSVRAKHVCKVEPSDSKRSSKRIKKLMSRRRCRSLEPQCVLLDVLDLTREGAKIRQLRHHRKKSCSCCNGTEQQLRKKEDLEKLAAATKKSNPAKQVVKGNNAKKR